MVKDSHPLTRLFSQAGTTELPILASFCSVMNKFWDLAPPVLIGIAVDVVALREESFWGIWVGPTLAISF